MLHSLPVKHRQTTKSPKAAVLSLAVVAIIAFCCTGQPSEANFMDRPSQPSGSFSFLDPDLLAFQTPGDKPPQAGTKIGQPRSAGDPKVTPINWEIARKFKLDIQFYKKHIDYKGFSILSSARVSDEALYEARYLIDKLLSEREDILNALIKEGCRFMVMAPTEMSTDVPEQRYMKLDPKTNWDTRARGLGGKLSSCGEENLLNLKGDRYNKENILIHEFNHAIHNQGLRVVDPTFNPRLQKAYKNAMAKGLWKGTYLTTNAGEYWAEAAQAYFDCMRPAYGANTREKLKEYDVELFNLVDEVYKQSQFRYVRYDVRNPPAEKKDQPDVKKDKK